MIRRLFTAVASVSLVLCTAVGVLWARSYRSRDAVEFDCYGARWNLGSSEGRLVLSDAPQLALDRAAARAAARAAQDEWNQVFGRYRERYRELRSEDHQNPFVAPEEVSAQRAEQLALRQGMTQSNDKVRASMARLMALTGVQATSRPLSHAVPAAALGLAPVAWLVLGARAGRRYRRRRAASLCPACAYDLRATPEKGGALFDRCPECGTIPTARGPGLTGRQVALASVSALLVGGVLYAVGATAPRPAAVPTAASATTRRATPPAVRATVGPSPSATVRPARGRPGTGSWSPDELDRMNSYFEQRDVSGDREPMPRLR